MKPLTASQLRLLFSSLLLCLAVILSLSFAEHLRQESSGPSPLHVHLPVEYKMIGRIYTDTLCVWPDTALVRGGDHRPIPQVLQGVARGHIDQSKVQIITTR